MKIIPNQKFRHDGQTYEEGQNYDVPDELGQYFKNVGWVGKNKELANKKHGTRAVDSGLVINESETEVQLG